MVNPCYKCPERHLGCHGACPRWAAWSQIRKAEREKQRKEFIVSCYIVDSVRYVKKRANPNKKVT